MPQSIGMERFRVRSGLMMGHYPTRKSMATVNRTDRNIFFKRRKSVSYVFVSKRVLDSVKVY